jgi:hypothetical protein
MMTDQQPTADTISPAMRFMDALWSGAQGATGHSWTRLNGAMHSGLMLAITAGLRFDEKDFSYCHREFRASYWIGADTERYYCAAVEVGNASAWKAYEQYTRRKPFVLKTAEFRNMTKSLPRLVVGAKFIWNKERVEVTSFKDFSGEIGKTPYVVACSYTREEPVVCQTCKRNETWPERKLLHMHKITHAELAAAKKHR